jgi:site-specific recombinase XerD
MTARRASGSPSVDSPGARDVQTIVSIARGLGVVPSVMMQAAALLRADVQEPTVAEAVTYALGHDRVLSTHYGRELRLLCEGVPSHAGFGARRVSDISDTELQDLLDRLREASAEASVIKFEQSISFAASSYGYGAQNRARTAWRRLFRRAEIRQWLVGDPTHDLTLGPRGASFAPHLTSAQLSDFMTTSATTGRDVTLDRLCILLFRYTGIRRSAAIALPLSGLDARECKIRTSTKNGAVHELPCKRDVIEEMEDLARRRGALAPRDAVLRGADGRSLTRGYFASMTSRVKRAHPWARPLRLGGHAIRRYVITELWSTFDPAVAVAWAGHAWTHKGTTMTYVRPPSFETMCGHAEHLFGPLTDPVPTSVLLGSPFSTPFGVSPGLAGETDDNPCLHPQDRPRGDR